MTFKDDGVYIEHMLACIQRIKDYTQGNKALFFDSTLVQDAVVRNLQTLTESSQRLSETCKNAHPAIPWRDISGFRNILVHDYLGLDLNVIWSVIEQELPMLEKVLKQMQ